MRLRFLGLLSACLIGVMFFFAASAVSAVSAASVSYDLSSALKRADEANKDIEAARAELLGARADQSGGLAGLLPRVYVSFDGRQQYSFKDKESHSDYVDQTTKTFRGGVRQPLFDLQAFYRWRGSVLEKKRAADYLRYIRLKVLYDTERQFFLYLRARQNVKSYQKAVERMQKQVESARAFYERQLKPRLHLLQVQTLLSKAESQLMQARNQLGREENRLISLLALPEQERAEFIGSLSNTRIYPLGELAVYTAAALSRRTDIAIQKKDVEIRRQGERLAWSDFFPSVTLSAEGVRYEIDYSDKRKDREHEYYTVGVNASWNLFQGGASFYSLRSRKQKTRVALLRLEKLQEDIRVEVRDAYLRVRLYEEQIALGRTYLREAEETWERVERGYHLGVSTATDLVDAARTLVDAEVELNVALADYNIARAGLAYVCGEDRSGQEERP